MTYTPGLNGGRINATIGGNTAGVGTLISTGSMTLAGGNNITLSQNGNAITISGGTAGGGGNNTIGMSNLGNTAGTSGMVSGSAFQYALAGGNNVTLSQSINGTSGTVTISAANQTVQTQNLVGDVNILGNTTGTTADISSGTMYLAGGSNVTLQQNGNSISIHGAQSVYMPAAGNTTGTTGVGRLGFAIQGGNNITLSGSNFISYQSVTISGPNMFNNGISNIGNTAGTSGTVSNQVILAGGNNVTLSQSTGAGGNTITISAPNFATAAAPWAQQLAGNTAGAMSTLTAGTVQWAGGGDITLSQTSNSISINGPNWTTLSRFEYPEGLFSSLNSAAQGSLSINHMYIPFYVSASAVKIGGSISAATNTSATTASANVSLWMGIYTLNGSSLSLASSGSANNGFQWSQSASSTGNTSINSMRQMTVPMNVNITPGEYWLAAVISSATTYTSFGFTVYGNSNVANAATAAVLSPIGSNTTAAKDVMLLQGIYTAATSVGPTSLSGPHINNTSASAVQRANFYALLHNATY